ncbi:MAG TPA: TolC family protein [Syntrophales bacterium]|nr:TolC family protein [Syntrophales bacterium]HPQ45513.1 TolC family protein [Syntrophales bacterium]
MIPRYIFSTSRHALQRITVLYTVVACVLFLLIPHQGVSSEITFSKALQIMHANNETISAALAKKNQSEEKKMAARGLFYPRIGISGRYSRINEPITIDLNSIRDVITTLHGLPSSSIPDFELAVQDEDFWQADLTMTWPIFTGGRILAANRAADAQVKASEAKVRSTESTLISELAVRYFRLRLAREMVELRRETLDAMAQHLYKAQKFEENGMIAKAERLHAEVSYANADKELKGAIRDVDIALESLNNILSLQESIEPASPLFILTTIQPITYFQGKAQEKNPILEQIAMQRVMAHQGYKKEIASFSPSVYLFGTRKLYTKDLTILEPEWIAGIGVDLTIFEGFSRSRQVHAAKFQEQEVMYLEKKMRRDIDTLVSTLYQELMKAREQFETLKTSRISAEEYFRVRNRAFEAGYATSLDVVDAQLALSRIKWEQLAAAYKFDVTLAQLLEASGSSKDLETYIAESDMEVTH